MLNKRQMRSAPRWLQGSMRSVPDSVWCAGVCDRPRSGTSWRHFAVLTINHGGSLKQDHLFLGREGTGYWKSEKFKVVTFERVFEIGSMPGLIDTFR